MSRKNLCFLCGHFEKMNFIYGVKYIGGEWYYFEDEDTIIDAHGKLTACLEESIAKLKNEVRSLAVSLNDNQLGDYIKDEIFIFQGKELKTYTQLKSRQKDLPSKRKDGSKSSDDFVFMVGKTNPAIFLNDFEKCSDVKLDKDKLFKIRNFVNQEDKPEFSRLFFEGDWESARNKFLKKYSYAFTENKRRELSCVFTNETSLRAFVIKKMDALSTYTSLTLKSRLEVILAELPNEISNLFVINDKMNCTKSEILEFCDSIEDFGDNVNTARSGSTTPIAQPNQQIQVVQDMEIFTYNSEVGSEVESFSGISSTSQSSRTRGKVRAKSSRGRGRPPKKMRMLENSETSQSDIPNSSQSSASSLFEY